jgi:hypothetical protein
MSAFTYGSKSWPLKWKDENMFRISERRITRYNHEHCKLYNEIDIVKAIKAERLRWLRNLSTCTMQEHNPYLLMTLSPS